jgi:hypothetical protein
MRIQLIRHASLLLEIGITGDTVWCLEEEEAPSNTIA